MADATLSELSEIVYVSEEDLRVLLASLVDGEAPDVDELVSEELCSELLDHLDPWPLVRRVPEYREDEPEPSVNPLALPD